MISPKNKPWFQWGRTGFGHDQISPDITHIRHVFQAKKKTKITAPPVGCSTLVFQNHRVFWLRFRRENTKLFMGEIDYDWAIWNSKHNLRDIYLILNGKYLIVGHFLLNLGGFKRSRRNQSFQRFFFASRCTAELGTMTSSILGMIPKWRIVVLGMEKKRLFLEESVAFGMFLLACCCFTISILCHCLCMFMLTF